jgi:glycosyltransferase involved in cell wall biosynthesis
VLVIVSHPIQYLCHSYRRLAGQPDVDLTVRFTCLMGAREYHDPGMGVSLQWKSDLLSGFKWSARTDSSALPEGDLVSRVLAMMRYLSAERPEVVLLHGYSSVECLSAWAWAIMHHRKLVLFGDGNGRIESQRPWVRRVLKRWALSLVLRRCDAVLSLGDANEQYWRRLGVPGERVEHAPLYLPDPEVFLLSDAARRDSRRSVRAKLGIGDHDFVAVYSGKFQRRKRVVDLVHAVDRTPGATCIYVGDGDTRSDCERAVAHPERHRFVGFANLDRLPSLYAAADVLVHPAEAEPYGLILAEAAMVGLPIVATSTAGAVGWSSHARPGCNALTFDVGDVTKLASHLSRLASARDELAAMSAQSRRIALEMQSVGLTGLRSAIGLRRDQFDVESSDSPVACRLPDHLP